MTTTHKPRAVITMVSDTEVRIERDFNAPARLVFEATSKPEYMKRWYGCDEMQMVRCDIDLRVGGGYHWTLRMPDGTEFNFRGMYRELAPPHRSVFTEQFLMGDTWTNELVNDITIADLADQRAKVTIRLLYQTKADRDGHLGSGMEAGMNPAHERLDALLAEMLRAA